MSEKSKIKSKNDENSEEIFTKNDQKSAEKSYPFWKKSITFISKYSFLAIAYLLEFFLKRARFALTAFVSFNILLIIFVCAEWLIYAMLVTEIIPNIFIQFFK